MALVLACGVAPGARGAAADEPPAGRPAAAGLEVRWDEDARDGGEHAAARWAGVLADVQERLGLAVSLQGAELCVVRGVERLRELSRAAAPEWAAGITVGGWRVVVRSDGPQGAPLRLSATLRHEAVHLVWARAAGAGAGAGARRLPRWFEEGLAEEVGGEPSVLQGEGQLELALARGEEIAFSALDTAWPGETLAASLAYQQARRWVGLFIAREGWAGVRGLLAAVRDDRDSSSPAEALDRALRSVTGNGLSDWHADWRLSVQRERPGWWMWLLQDVGGVLLMLLALGCALGYASLRRRRRRAIEALPDEPEAPAAPDEALVPPGLGGLAPGGEA
ncbi:MAG: hypothetical protein ACKOSS_08375, partial [Planctomycetia bacterium]